MEDLFNFSNTDNILGNTEPKQKGIGIGSTPPSILDTQRSRSGISDTAVGNNHDSTEQKEDSIHSKKKSKASRIALIGDPQVGKTTFLTKHLNDSFNASYNATIGASTFNLQFNTNLDSHNFEVLDVAGQNLFAGKRDKYYKDIDGALIMYDVMNWSSYDNICDVWLKELKEKGPSNIPICIVGNKMENREIRKVSVEVVAEAISQKFEPDGIGYCEISVKTNQNLAEPFLFLTKRILNINDSKALYFVSKISELNLIESMLQHKKNQDEKNKTPQMKSTSDPQNLDNLFLNDNVNTMDTATSKKGGDYLDDFIFSIDNKNKHEQKTTEESSNTMSNTQTHVQPQKQAQPAISIGDDDNFLADMMASQPQKKSKVIPKVLPKVMKTQSISPKTSNNMSQKQQQQQQIRNRSTSVASGTNNKNKKTAIIAPPPKTKQATRAKAKATTQSQSQSQRARQQDNGVMIDILLGIQETLNNLQSDVRKLQSDVSYLKHEFQQTKSQRR